MFRFEHLEIWKDAISFSGKVYTILLKFPKEEMYALCNQLRRAVVSISANIAEGRGSSSAKDFKNYLSIAIKSTFEVVSLFAIALQNRYITNQEFDLFHKDAEVLAKRIHAFRNSLKA